MKSLIDVLIGKLAKRNVSFKNLEYGKLEVAPTGGARQEIKIIQGLETEKAKIITQAIRDTKLKVQAQIQERKVRVTGKNRDDLQAVISMIRGREFEMSLSFNNFRD